MPTPAPRWWPWTSTVSWRISTPAWLGLRSRSSRLRWSLATTLRSDSYYPLGSEKTRRCPSLSSSRCKWGLCRWLRPRALLETCFYKPGLTLFTIPFWLNRTPLSRSSITIHPLLLFCNTISFHCPATAPIVSSAKSLWLKFYYWFSNKVKYNTLWFLHSTFF